MKLSEAKAIRAAIEAGSNAVERSDEAVLQVYGLYPKWKPGKHTKGDIYNALGQTWECYQDYDNAVYPDIRPGEAAWFTFNRPLHGKTRETARPWVAPTHSMDIYKLGEWMVWTDGTLCECIAENGTNFSPEEYPAGWRTDEPMMP
jgi:hypothetical protein